jgi:RNA polymerase sigma-70 factor (ECF subfamily)
MNEFSQVLEREIPYLRRYARALVRNAPGADDLVQSCLVRALSKQHLWQEGTNLRSWLFTILHNQRISDLRRSAREERALAALATAELPLAIPFGGDPAAWAHLYDVDRALAHLPEAQRSALKACPMARRRRSSMYRSAPCARASPARAMRCAI